MVNGRAVAKVVVFPITLCAHYARSERLREKVEGRWFSARHKRMTHSPFLTVRTTVHQFKTITSYSQTLKANVTGTGWETEKKLDRSIFSFSR